MAIGEPRYLLIPACSSSRKTLDIYRDFRGADNRKLYECRRAPNPQPVGVNDELDGVREPDPRFASVRSMKSTGNSAIFAL